MATSKTIRRKLQFAGNSSFVVTLPKWWIKKIGLDKNSEVSISENSDGSLLVSPVSDLTPVLEDNPQTIVVEKHTDPNSIVRSILAAYLSSKTKIVVEASRSLGEISGEIMVAVNQITGKLWGAEIIEEQLDRIVIQDALNLSQMSLLEIIRKAWFTASNMLNQTHKAIFMGNQGASIIVSNSETTLDKLYYLALRQLYKSSKDGLFAKIIGISTSDVIDYHLLIKNIERIADHCEKVINSYVDGMTYTLEEEFQMTSENCKLAVKSFLENDPEQAEQVIQKKDSIVRHVNEITVEPHEVQLRVSIIRLADYSSDIAELVINRKFAN